MNEMNDVFERSSFENSDTQRYSLAAFAKMNAFRKRSQLCDVIVKVGEREFPAHRVVLAASSDYFDAMFSSGMAESAQLEVELKSVSPDVMEALLDFVYTGQVQVSMENVQDLLPAASLVQMEGVKAVCSAFLFGEVDASNVLGIRRFAELHSCNELEAFAKNYAAHNFETVIEHEEFLFLSVDELSELLSREDLHVDSEETAYKAMIRWVYRDTDERTPSLPHLLNHLRLAIMSVRFLTDVVDREPLIRMSMECRDLVDAAKRFHLRPDLRYQMRNQQFRQRDGGDEYLVVIGGFGSYQSPSDSVEMFNPRTREWSELPNLPISYRYVAACSLGTCVYVIGGFDGGERLSTVGLLDVAQREDGWRWLAPMHYKRGLSAACTHKGLIYVCGGFDGQTRLRALEVYHPKIDEWRVLEEMNTAREGAGLVVADDCLYCLGGYDGFQLLNSMESFDLRGGTWSTCKPMYMRRSGAGCAVLGDTIYVCGGYGGAEGRGPLHLDTVESYNTRLSQWTLVCSMNVPRCYVGACQLAGLIYVAAGYNGNRLLNTVEAFDPIENCWTLYEENRMHNERCDTGMCVVRFLSYAEPNTILSSSHPGSSTCRIGDAVPNNVIPPRSRLGAGPALRSFLNVRSASIAHDSLGRSPFSMDSGTPSVSGRTLQLTGDTVTGRLRSGRHQIAVPIQSFERTDDSSTRLSTTSPLFQAHTAGGSQPTQRAFTNFSQPTPSSLTNRISTASASSSGQPPGSVQTGLCDTRPPRGLMFSSRSETSFTRVSYNGAPFQTSSVNGGPLLPSQSVESLHLESSDRQNENHAVLLEHPNSIMSRIAEDDTPLAGVSDNVCEGEVLFEEEDEAEEVPVLSGDCLRDDSELFLDDMEPLVETSFASLNSFQLSRLPTIDDIVDSFEPGEHVQGCPCLDNLSPPHFRPSLDPVGEEQTESVLASFPSRLSLNTSSIPIHTHISIGVNADVHFSRVSDEYAHTLPADFLVDEDNHRLHHIDMSQFPDALYTDALSHGDDIDTRQVEDENCPPPCSEGGGDGDVRAEETEGEEEFQFSTLQELGTVENDADHEASRLAYLNLEEAGVPNNDEGNPNSLSQILVRNRQNEQGSLFSATLPGHPSSRHMFPVKTSKSSVYTSDIFAISDAVEPNYSVSSTMAAGLPVPTMVSHHPQSMLNINSSPVENVSCCAFTSQIPNTCAPQPPTNSTGIWSHRSRRTSSVNQPISIGADEREDRLFEGHDFLSNHRAPHSPDERHTCIYCTAHTVVIGEATMSFAEETASSVFYNPDTATRPSGPPLQPEEQPDLRSDGEGEEGENPIPATSDERQPSSPSPSGDETISFVHQHPFRDLVGDTSSDTLD